MKRWRDLWGFGILYVYRIIYIYILSNYINIICIYIYIHR
jgi:hypothetical protein